MFALRTMTAAAAASLTRRTVPAAAAPLSLWLSRRWSRPATTASTTTAATAAVVAHGVRLFASDASTSSSVSPSDSTSSSSASSLPEPQSASHWRKVAFIGLGAMGFPMAANLCSKYEMMVWNRSTEKAQHHASTYGSTVVTDMAQLGEAQGVFMCLPTSEEVESMLDVMTPHLAPGTFVVDCTSGHPLATQRMAAKLAERGVHLLDCAVSGGPGGAHHGTLAAFVGGPSGHVKAVVPAIETFAKQVVHLGPVSAGHAVKAFNNALNVSNLLTCAEGLLALKKMGIEPARALNIINASSGRSLMSEQRIPQDVLNGWFNYGFRLDLMRKDVQIANELLDAHYPDASIIRNTRRLIDDAMDMPTVPDDADYTEVVKLLEDQAGTDLRQDHWAWTRK